MQGNALDAKVRVERDLVLTLARLADKLVPETWLQLALTSLEDETKFKYRTKEQEYIPFANASAGQQATALLITLLNQPGPPLVIDQPEDDLDNQIIFDIVARIWRAKTRRQLIFSSHNANLVVNGDAELVVWCDHWRCCWRFCRPQVSYATAISLDERQARVAQPPGRRRHVRSQPTTAISA